MWDGRFGRLACLEVGAFVVASGWEPRVYLFRYDALNRVAPLQELLAEGLVDEVFVPADAGNGEVGFEG